MNLSSRKTKAYYRAFVSGHHFLLSFLVVFHSKAVIFFVLILETMCVGECLTGVFVCARVWGK